MSRIGRLPVKIPAGVTVDITDSKVIVKGSKGELQETVLGGISVVQEDDQVIVARKDNHRINRSNHGLMRSLINNMIVGVSQGFSKELEVNGVGYRVAVAGNDLRLKLGFSHEVVYSIPVGIDVQVEQNKIKVSGISRQLVGQAASEIREFKKPEPYKGKGIQYTGERILRKSGKSGKE